MAKKGTTRYFSNKQETTIAHITGGKKVSGSGSPHFCVGDVITKDFLIECKTSIKPKESFSIKKEWLIKNNMERMSLGKPFSALVFQFEPDGENHFIINEDLFIRLIDYIEEEERGNKINETHSSI